MNDTMQNKTEMRTVCQGNRWVIIRNNPDGVSAVQYWTGKSWGMIYGRKLYRQASDAMKVMTAINKLDGTN